MRQHRGFTLVEILIALVIMGLVTGALFQLLTNTQRLSRAQAEQVDLQSNVRAGSLVVPNELRELNTVVGGGADQNDILVANPDEIRYRAVRGFYLLCEPTTSTQVRVLASSLGAYRNPQAGRDSMYVFIEGDPDKEQDDVWLRAAITGVASGNACPGGAASITLTTPANAALAAQAVGTPVRVFEVMEVKLYQPDGRSWLGARSVSANEVIQPLLGPLTDGTGFQLQYFDANGAATANLTAIKSIQVTVRGLTDEAVRSNASTEWSHPEEELVTQVLLRNSIRP